MSLLIAEIMYDLIERKLHHSNRRDDSHSQHRHHKQLQHKYELNHHFVANSWYYVCTYADSHLISSHFINTVADKMPQRSQ